MEGTMNTIQLYKENPDTYERELLGTVTEAHLDFLIDNLEDEFEEDEQYFINQSTVDYLRDQGADDDLISILEKALAGAPDGVEILYQF